MRFNREGYSVYKTHSLRGVLPSVGGVKDVEVVANWGSTIHRDGSR